MLENLIKTAKEAYYQGSPIMTDEIFDYLVTMAEEESIGYKSTYERRYKHLFPLFSLQKVIKGIDSAPDWGGVDFITTAKLDGAAISILYGGGEIQKALTRGDGIEGLDITPLIKTLVPNKINYNEVIQISGEVVAPKEIPNARNYAAGALNLSTTECCWVTDVAYSVVPPSCLSLEFVYWLRHTLRLDLLGKGIKPGLSRSDPYKLVFGLPPVSEQKRIVSKINELMAICDALKSAIRKTQKTQLLLADAITEQAVA